MSLAPQTLRSLSLGLLKPGITTAVHLPLPHRKTFQNLWQVVSGRVTVSPRTLGGHKAGARLKRGGHERVCMGGWERGLLGVGGASQAPDHGRGQTGVWLGVR